jgi:N-formylglutamate deformylase
VFGEDDEQIRHALLSRFFMPYAEALADLGDERVAVTGQAIVIDLHCYLVEALPCEGYQDARRPAVCVGVDFGHTPAALVRRVSRAFSVVGDDAVNEPFIRTGMAIRHFGRDNRVASVMRELRRDVYLREVGSLDPQGAGRISEALVAILRPEDCWRPNRGTARGFGAE